MNVKHLVGYSVTALVALMIGTGIGSSSGDAGSTSAAANGTPAPTVTVTGASEPGPTVTVTATSPAKAATTTVSKATFEGDGTYQVGVDIKPGTYVSTKPDLNCYWARLKGSGGSFADIIANNNSQGRSVVTIKKSDKFFETKGCNTWTKR